MTVSPHIIVLCNNRMAFPAIDLLLRSGMLSGVVVPADNAEVSANVSAVVRGAVKVVTADRKSFERQLRELLRDDPAAYVFSKTFPWKIPESLLRDYPDKFFNFHYGLLPEMRGVDPVFQVLRSRSPFTGITVHEITNEIDCGPILLRREIPVGPGCTHGLLCTQLSQLGAGILQEVIAALQANRTPVAQPEKNPAYYGRPGISDVCIDWEGQNSLAAEALIRACNPWNKGAYTQWKGWNLRILEAEAGQNSQDTSAPGTIISATAGDGIVVQCAENTSLKIRLLFTEEGYMTSSSFLQFGLQKGEKFTSIKL